MRGTKTYSPYITPKKIRRHFWGTLIFASSSSSSSSFPPTQMIYPCPAAAAAKGTERGGGWNGPTDAAIIIFLFEIPECEFPHLFLSKKKEKEDARPRNCPFVPKSGFSSPLKDGYIPITSHGGLTSKTNTSHVRQSKTGILRTIADREIIFNPRKLQYTYGIPTGPRQIRSKLQGIFFCRWHRRYMTRAGHKE